jgi:amidase
MAANPTELAEFDALGLADLIRRKVVAPIEVVDEAIARIERLNPTINAVVTTTFEEARRVALTGTDGPLAGVPFLLKDAGAESAGLRMTLGSRFLGDYVPSHDSELVRRLKRAGVIILGTTNTPEFYLMGTTEPERFGPTRNPWALDRSTGGSSGGAAAAVAAGMVPAALGGDIGGSIRIPAACCGVFGFKPTRGRNPLGPDFGDIVSGMVVEHALTRSVRDSAALLDATSGPMAGDPYPAPPLDGPLLDSVGRPPGRLRVAYSSAALNGVPVAECMVGATLEAAALCDQLGHSVSEGAPRISGAELDDALDVIGAAGVAWHVEHWARVLDRRPTEELLEAPTWALYERGLAISAEQYLAAVQRVQRLGREVAEFFTNECDVWLTPTVSNEPLLLGALASPPDDPFAGARRDWANSPFTALFNATGQPAMSVPLSTTEAGLPLGAHFSGRFGDEATLFALAGQLEAVRSWHDRGLADPDNRSAV